MPNKFNVGSALSSASSLKFELLKKRHLHQGFFQLNEYTFRNQLYAGGWSEAYTREIFERGHAAAVLLLDVREERVVLVEQFRPGAVETEESPWLLELVAGIIEEGETPEQVVRRESLEEAHCRVGKVKKICEYLASPGGTTERIWLFVAEVDSNNLAEFGGLSHEQEDIRICSIAVDDIFQMLDSGAVNNAMTIIALQWLKLNWQDRENLW